MKKILLNTAFLMLVIAQLANAQTKYQLSSPDQSLLVSVSINNKALSYTISRNAEPVLNHSALGLVRGDA